MLRLARWAILRTPSAFPRILTYRYFSARDPITGLTHEIARLQQDSPSDIPALSNAYLQLSTHYLKQWNLTQAKSTLTSLEKLLAGSQQRSQKLMGECLFELGEVCYNLLESQEAKRHYEGALAAFQSERPSNSLNIAKTYFGLGNTHQSLGDFPEALRCYQEAERLADAAGPNRENLLSMINQGYAFISRMKNKQDDAMSFAKIAVELVDKKTDRSSNQILADAYECLGDVHMSKKEQPQAIDMYSKSLSLRKVLFPSHHPEVGKAMGKLGAGLIAGNQYAEAARLFKNKLEIDLAALGENHSTVADDYHDIAFTSVRLQQIDEAESAYTNEIRILTSLPSIEPSRLASAHLNLMNVKMNKRLVPAAIEQGTKGVEILRKSPKHKDQLGFALGQLGEMSMQIKNLTEAKKFLQEAYHVKVQALPKDDAEIGKSLVLLGQVMGMTKEKQAAEELIVQGVTILRKRLKKDDIQLAISLAKQGTAYASNGKMENAVESFKEAVLIFRKKLPQGSAATVNSSLQLISLYMANKMFLDAENVYRRLIVDIEQSKKQSSYDFPKMVQSLYALLQAQEKHEECTRLRAKYQQILS